MPRLTRWFVKASFVYLVGALLALWTLPAVRVGLLPSSFTAWSPAYVHLFTLGWLSQLIFGIAHWMLPMYTKEQPRGRESLVWGTWITVNAGLLIRAAVEPVATAQPGSVWGWLLVLSATLQWLGGVLFVINTWPRVKPRRVSRKP